MKYVNTIITILITILVFLSILHMLIGDKIVAIWTILIACYLRIDCWIREH